MNIPLLAVLLLTISSPVLSGRSKKELCNVCKDFIKKFEDGMKRTDNKNFGGGDTDWEERKLGSFARSETRLVEILENVCENVSPKHACNGMVEDHEEQIEQWWFKIHGTIDEFEKHLCFDELKFCCPKGHYGKKCKECTGGPENPCNGKGSCSGDGWRGGNGKCKCDEGYEGDICEKCKEGYERTANATCEKPKEEEEEDDEDKEDAEEGSSPQNRTTEEGSKNGTAPNFDSHDTQPADEMPSDESPPKDAAPATEELPQKDEIPLNEEVALESESSSKDTLPQESVSENNGHISNGTPSDSKKPSQDPWKFVKTTGGNEEL